LSLRPYQRHYSDRASPLKASSENSETAEDSVHLEPDAVVSRLLQVWNDVVSFIYKG